MGEVIGKMDSGTSCYNRFLAGDENGLVDIVNMYGDSLMLFINSFVNNLSTAEELMEDVFMELVVKKHKFKEESSFKTYLFKIGRNKAFNFLKRNKRYTYIEDKEIEDDVKFEENIVKDEEQKQIHTVLKLLPKDYKTVLYLIYFEDMSYDEIGMVMRKSNKQVKNLAYRARIALKEKLRKEGFSYEK